MILPLNNIEWALEGTDARPSLHPSVGNWNLKCKSHYVLGQGRVQWRRRYSEAEIEVVRRRDLKPYQRRPWTQRVGDWVKRLVAFLRDE